MNRPPIVGRELHEQAGAWRRLLQAWQASLSDYVRIAQGGDMGADLPYWYNERANVGFLVAAAWRLGGAAIEEYTVDKPRQGTKGRADLWLRVPRLGLECRFEAKVHWPADTAAAKRACNALLRQASTQMKQYSQQGSGGCLRMAVNFIVADTATIKRGRQVLRGLYDWLSKQQDVTQRIIALYEPSARVEVSYMEKGRTRFCPGVLLVAHLIEKGKSWRYLT